MSIPYAPTSWNPVTGCSEISAGCKRCWAKVLAESPRLRGRFGYDAVDPFKITFHEDKLDLPRHWRKPRVIAVNFMGDWCHEHVPKGWRGQVWQVMRDCPQHTFITSTKRPRFMVREVRALGPLQNAWHGVTIETQDVARLRMPQTKGIARLYVNYEPALTSVGWSADCGLDGLAGIIVGAESGKNARPFNPEWAEVTREACKQAGVCFYMKQMAPSMGGANWDKWPKSLEHLKVRELPWRLGV